MAANVKQIYRKDVDYDCEWHLEGTSKEEMLPTIEKHAAKVHDLICFKDQAVENVLNGIRRSRTVKSLARLAFDFVQQPLQAILLLACISEAASTDTIGLKI